MPHYHSTNFEIQKYYHNETTFSGAYSRNNLSKIKNWSYIINLDEHDWIGTHWTALYANAKNVTYFDCFGVEHNQKEIRKFIRNKIL